LTGWPGAAHDAVMSGDKIEPRTTPETDRIAEARRLRLAAELRANLVKRKAQERARAGDDARDEDESGDGA
jgi:hypothetical protein